MQRRNAAQKVAVTHREDDLASSDRIRGSNWLRISRLGSAFFLMPFAAQGIISGGTNLAKAPAAIGFLGLIMGLWELRARRMGVWITPEAIVTRRAVSTVRVQWDGIDRFFASAAGLGFWRDQLVRVHRTDSVQRVPLSLPTMWIIGQTNPIGRRLGPCWITVGRRRIHQDEFVDFLDEELARRREASGP